MTTLCTFGMPSGRGEFHVFQDDSTAGPIPDVVVQLVMGRVIDEALRANGAEDCAAVIMDMAREIARLQQLVKGK